MALNFMEKPEKPYLEIYESEDIARIFELKREKEVVTIGRSPDNNICILNRKVSRHHCFIYFKNDDSWNVQDGNLNATTGDVDEWSTNGTFLNGYCIKQNYGIFPLRDGDEITFSSDSFPKLIFIAKKEPDTGEINHPTLEHEYEE